MLFEQLSAQGQLYPELAAIRTTNPGVVNGQFDQALAANPAAVQFAAEAEAWLSHFEAAAPAARALANAYPGRREFTSKASALYRSLAAYDPRDTEIAVVLAGYEQRADPRDASILARMGDILADRELFTRARAYWERMPAAQPGNPSVIGASSEVAALIVQKLIGPQTQRSRDWRDAPMAVSPDIRAGNEGDLETRIDGQPLPADAGCARFTDRQGDGIPINARPRRQALNDLVH